MNKEILFIKEHLIKSILRSLEHSKNFAIAFSGGLDSTIIAKIAKDIFKGKILLYTIGFKNSYDIRMAQKTAFSLGLPLKLIYLDQISIKRYYSEYIRFSSDNNKVSISFTLPLYILLNKIKENIVIAGHGADTLFGGFYKYLKSSDIKRDIKNNYITFLSTLPKREYLIAKRFNKNLILPFASENLYNFVIKLPKEKFIKENERKILLKELAKDLGINNYIIKQNKKAIQYGTGIIKELKRIW